MTPDKRVEEIVERLWKRFKSVLGYSSIDAKNNSMHDLENFVREALTQYHQDLISEVVEKIRQAFEKKATLTENPIEQNGELIDGSFYQIYKGDFEHVLKRINEEQHLDGETCDIPINK